jgi:hypothetical protein
VQVVERIVYCLTPPDSSAIPNPDSWSVDRATGSISLPPREGLAVRALLSWALREIKACKPPR